MLNQPDENLFRDKDAARNGSELSRLKELCLFFLRLGTTAFGGPAAHIAIMEDELVRRRKWLSRETFLDLLGASSLIPGPSSSELAIHLGYLRGGWMGLVAGGICFILPAAVLVSCLSWAYVHFGHLPAVVGILYGIKPVVIAVILQALWGLGHTALKNRALAIVCALCVALSFAGANVLAILAVAGIAMAIIHAISRRQNMVAAALPISSPSLWRTFGWKAKLLLLAATGTATAAVPKLWELFGVFLKIGSVVFGSGYVLLAFLRVDLVAHRGWVTDAQLVDAVAIGQVTPGPVFTTATFLGYLLRGPVGAVVATVGIFLPAFVLVAISGPLVPHIRNSPAAGAFLDGVNAASLAIMAAVSYDLARSAVVDGWTAALLILSAILLLRFRVNSAWLVLGGAIIGIATQFFRAG